MRIFFRSMRGSNHWNIETTMGFISNHKLDGDIYNFTFHDIKKFPMGGISYYETLLNHLLLILLKTVV